MANAVFKVIVPYSVTINGSDITGATPSTKSYAAGNVFIAKSDEDSIVKLVAAGAIAPVILNNIGPAVDASIVTYTPTVSSDWTPVPTTMQSAIDEVIGGDQGKTKSLSNTVAAALFTVTVAPGEMFGASVYAIVTATDGTDMQVRAGDVSLGVVNKAGAFTLASTQNTAASVSAGTLTNVYSITEVGNVVTVKVAASSSLTPTSMKITYYVAFATGSVNAPGHSVFNYV